MKRKKIMKQGVLFGNLLFSLSVAITLYINSSFIEKFLGVEYTSIIYSISSFFSIILLIYSRIILKKFGNGIFFLFFGNLYVISLGILVLPFDSVSKIVALFIYLFSVNIILFSINIFFSHLTELKGRGRFRGAFLMLGNLGTMIGPIIATIFINQMGFGVMYLSALIIFTIVALIINHTFNQYKDSVYKPINQIMALKHTLREKIFRNVIAANFILQFFYAWMIIYVPIYLNKILGFSWQSIGIIFTIMLSTFVLLDYPLGKIADKIKSEKELTALGFIIMIISVFSLTFISNPSILTVGIIMFFSRVGAATVEAMTEIHFFKITDDSEPEIISLFCDLRPLAYIIAPLTVAISLIFVTLQNSFVILGFILLLGFWISFYMEKDQKLWVPEHKN